MLMLRLWLFWVAWFLVGSFARVFRVFEVFWSWGRFPVLILRATADRSYGPSDWGMRNRMSDIIAVEAPLVFTVIASTDFCVFRTRPFKANTALHPGLMGRVCHIRKCGEKVVPRVEFKRRL
jgi:hypothetical protein